HTHTHSSLVLPSHTHTHTHTHTQTCTSFRARKPSSLYFRGLVWLAYFRWITAWFLTWVPSVYILQYDEGQYLTHTLTHTQTHTLYTVIHTHTHTHTNT